MSVEATAVRPRARTVIDDLAATGRYHFTAAEMRSALGVSSAASKLALGRLIKKRQVASPARGFYVIVPPEYRSLGCLPADQFMGARHESEGFAVPGVLSKRRSADSLGREDSDHARGAVDRTA